MLSRVAHNIYWMARYLERAEDTARIINVNTNLLLDLPRSMTFGWLPLIFIVGAEKQFFEKEPNRLADEITVVKFLIGDVDNPGSILRSLAAARENLRTTRDVTPQEAWEMINGLYIFARDHLPTRRGRFEFLRRIIHGAQQINGLLAGSMSRTAAYDFVKLGRFLERADMTTRILDVRSANLLPRPGLPVTPRPVLEINQTQYLSTLTPHQTPQPHSAQSSTQIQRQIQGATAPTSVEDPFLNQEEQDPFDSIQWMSVLKSLSAYQMYRQQVRLRVGASDVVKFLLQDQSFPRAVGFCLKEMAAHLLKLPKNDALLIALAALEQRLNLAEVSELTHAGLHEFIDEFQIALGDLHNLIASTYFME